MLRKATRRAHSSNTEGKHAFDAANKTINDAEDLALKAMDDEVKATDTAYTQTRNVMLTGYRIIGILSCLASRDDDCKQGREGSGDSSSGR